MKESKVFYQVVNNTNDCLKLLPHTNFKIKAMFNMCDNTVRIFTDGVETYSIISDNWETQVIQFDLRELIPLISKVKQAAKHIVNYDYGQIYLNPFEMKLWVVGGDGGICYWDKSIQELISIIDSNFELDSLDDDLKLDFPEINEVIVEAEHNPDDDYVLIAKAIDLCDYDTGL